MANNQLYRVKTIAQYHELMGLPGPAHPLVSVVDLSRIQHPEHDGSLHLLFELYTISLKRISNVTMKYGQQEYDYNDGLMYFMSPGQLFSIASTGDAPVVRSGLLLLIHPDFLWHTPLARGIRRYDFFDYAVHEALYLSDREEAIIDGVIRHIDQECHSNIDKFSQDIIIAQLEVLLNYSERFYQRQFITRKKSSHQLLEKLEEWLAAYFEREDIAQRGLPSVQAISEALHVSPNYLSTLLKTLTGQSTQQHIHEKLIEKAKQQLSTTDLTVSQIAYSLGFEHSQSFSKLFKSKTNVSPLEFRAGFN
ncbi:MAG: helix-turn-helix transcriptional regulator [Bacteroidetes bacterium]|nr:helix-turn-helix transcriptional regulator [Bacteroidota bacterium]